MDVSLHDQKGFARHFNCFRSDQIAEILVQIGKRLRFPRKSLGYLATDEPSSLRSASRTHDSKVGAAVSGAEFRRRGPGMVWNKSSRRVLRECSRRNWDKIVVGDLEAEFELIVRLAEMVSPMILDCECRLVLLSKLKRTRRFEL